MPDRDTTTFHNHADSFTVRGEELLRTSQRVESRGPSMQASRTAHYAWLYRGSRASRIAPSSRAASSLGHGWSGDVAPKAGAAASASPLRPRVSPLSRSRPDGRDLPAEAGVSAAMARSHFIEAQ